MYNVRSIILLSLLLSAWSMFAYTEVPLPKLTEKDKDVIREHLDKNSVSYLLYKKEPVYRLFTDGGPDLVEYLDSLVASDRSRAVVAHQALCMVATESKVGKTRQAAVLAIARQLLDGSARAVPTATLVWLYGRLGSADFFVEAQATAKRALTRIVTNELPASAEAFALCGASGDKSLIPFLEQCGKRMPHEGNKDYPLSMRPALLASARLGHKESVRECIRLVDALPELLRVRNIETLSYVRQPEVAEYIRPFLFSDAKEPDLGIDALGGPYAASASGAFHEMLVGFPWQEDLQTRRKWVTDLKEWPLKR